MKSSPVKFLAQMSVPHNILSFSFSEPAYLSKLVVLQPVCHRLPMSNQTVKITLLVSQAWTYMIYLLFLVYEEEIQGKIALFVSQTWIYIIYLLFLTYEQEIQGNVRWHMIGCRVVFSARLDVSSLKKKNVVSHTWIHKFICCFTHRKRKRKRGHIRWHKVYLLFQLWKKVYLKCRVDLFC